MFDSDETSEQFLGLSVIPGETDREISLGLVLSLPEMLMPGETVMISLGEAEEVATMFLTQLLSSVAAVQTIKADMHAHPKMSAEEAIDIHKRRTTSRLN